MLKNGIIWFTAIIIASFSILIATGSVAKEKAPKLAITLAPVNGFAFQNLAADQIKAMVAKNQGQFPDKIDSDAYVLARQSFLSEPLATEAIAVLALGATDGKKRKLMQQAFALSRREKLVTGWLISDGGMREDIPAILRYYDTMLRTSSSAASVILPIMSGALANDAVIPPFVSLFSKKPPWSLQFWQTVISMPQSVKNAARLRELLHSSDEKVDQYYDIGLINALVVNQNFIEAEKLYNLFVPPQASGTIIRNGLFDHEPRYPPFDWTLFSTAEYGATISSRSLQLSAIGNSGGLFARQLVKLPPSDLIIEIKSNQDIPDTADLKVAFSCAEEGDNSAINAEIRLNEKTTRQQINNKKSGCDFYWFDFIGKSTDNDGFDLFIQSVLVKLN